MIKRLAILLAFALSAFAQQQQPSQARKPDCLLYLPPLTQSVQNSLTIDNRTVGCYTWAFSYLSNGFTGETVTVQSAPDNNGVPGTWVTFVGTATVGANPMTATTYASVQLTGYNPWVRINLNGITGTGTVRGILTGFLPGSSSSAGGSGTVTSITATAPLTAAPNPITNTGTMACPTCTTNAAAATLNAIMKGAGLQAIVASGVTIDSSNNILTPGSVSTGVGGGASGELDQTGVTSLNVVAIKADDDTPGATVNNSRVSGRLAVRSDTFTTGDCVQVTGSNKLAVLTDAGAPCGSGGGGASAGATLFFIYHASRTEQHGNRDDTDWHRRRKRHDSREHVQQR